MSSAEILSLKGVMAVPARPLAIAAPALEAMAGVAPVCQVQTLPLVEHLRLDRALATRGADPHEARCADEDDERHPRASLATAAGRRGAPPGLGLRGDSFRRPPETVKREPGACRARRGAGARDSTSVNRARQGKFLCAWVASGAAFRLGVQPVTG